MFIALPNKTCRQSGSSALIFKEAIKNAVNTGLVIPNEGAA